MSPSPTRIPPTWALLLAAVIHGLAIHALLPSGVVLLDDDFGYLKSIIQTFQHGRPWTDDFLEPWSASTSTLTAVAFALTGNFHLAAYGLQSAFAAAGLPALCLMLAGRGFAPRTMLVVAALVLTFPVLLWRALEFTGMALYVPCLLWAIWAAERRRWGVFAAVFLLAVANRQSAAVWLVLPACAALRAYFPRPGVGFTAARAPGAVILGGVLVIAALHLGMNTTDSQRMLFYQTLSRFELQGALQTTAFGAAVFALAVGLSAALHTLSRDPPAHRAAPRGLPLLGLFALAVVLLVLDERRFAIVDRVDIGWRGGWLYTKLIVALGLAGWIGFRFRLRAAPTLCAAASVLLVSLRPSAWDYYFVDTALLGFFAVAPSPAAHPAAVVSPLPLFRYWRPLLVTALAAAGLFHLLSTLHLKTVLDEAHAITGLYERALRRGQLRHNETAGAPFGFGGWHLYAHGVARRGDTHTRWFSVLFTAPEKSVELAVAYPESFPRRWRHASRTRPDPGLVLLADETVRIAWFWDCRYVLQRQAPPLSPSPLGPDFRPIRFPLNNAEWRELASGPPLR